MKICVISPQSYPLFNVNVKALVGGAEVQMALLAKELAKDKNLDIHFMVADYGQEADVEQYDGVTVWKALNLKENLLKKSVQFFSVFNKIGADVYIQMALATQSGLIATYCKIFRKRFVYLIASDMEVNDTLPILKKPITKFIANLTFKYADGIVSQNKFQQTQLLLKGLQSAIIPSFHHIDGLSFHDNTEAKHHLWVGRSSGVKQPEIYLELAKCFPQEKFVIVCQKNTDSSEEYYKNLVAQGEAIPNVEFVQFVPVGKINDYFKYAKTFINTSSHEGFPTTFIEAGKNCTPILSLNVNPNSFLTTHNCGLVSNGDFQKLQENLTTMLSNKSLYKEMVMSIFDYMYEHHDLSRNAKKLLKIVG